jgi:ribosomal protein S18 acetylase RimI-like enzyme
MGKAKIERVGGNATAVIEDIARRTWPDAYGKILSQEQLQYMLDKFYNAATLKERMLKNSIFYLIKERKAALGFMELGLNECGHTCKLHKLYILPNQQGRHLGRQLIDHAIAVCREFKQTGLYLNVNRHNKALGFYEKMGFKIILSEDIDIGNGFYMNDYVLQINFD